MKNSNKNSGFTLIETFVAISIFLLVLPAFFAAAQLFITATTSAKDQVTALFLAQDAIEYMRAKIADNEMDPTQPGFDDGFGSCVPSVKNCLFDSRNDDSSGGSDRYTKNTNWDLTDCPMSGCPVLRINQATGEYGYDPGAGWVDSRYTRSINLERLDASREIRITATVTWPSAFGTKEVHLQTLLFRP